MDRKTIKNIWKACSKQDKWDLINERAKLKAQLDEVEYNGVIGVCESSMDCDCVKGGSARRRPRLTLIEEWKRNEDYYHYLEGPGSMWYCDPREIKRDESWSRDLIMEAFEDGHPHVVYA